MGLRFRTGLRFRMGLRFRTGLRFREGLRFRTGLRFRMGLRFRSGLRFRKGLRSSVFVFGVFVFVTTDPPHTLIMVDSLAVKFRREQHKQKLWI